jgi:hypothetical protein
MSTEQRPPERWPPGGTGNADALADIYNAEYELGVLERGLTPSAAHQYACEIICKLGGAAGTASKLAYAAPETRPLEVTVSVNGPDKMLWAMSEIIALALSEALKDRLAGKGGS